MKSTHLFLIYWFSFIISVCILVLNFGVKLILLGIVYVALFVLHFDVGISLNRILKQYKLVLYSCFSFIVYTLVRSDGDGEHSSGYSGIGSLLSLFDLYWDDRVLLESLWYIEYLLLLQQFILELIIISHIQKEKETTC